MKVAVLGGLQRLEREYLNLLEGKKIKGRIFNKMTPEFTKSIENMDGVILFTDNVSHNMVNSCCKICKKRNICLLRFQKGSLCSIEKAITCFTDMKLLPG